MKILPFSGQFYDFFRKELEINRDTELIEYAHRWDNLKWRIVKPQYFSVYNEEGEIDLSPSPKYVPIEYISLEPKLYGDGKGTYIRAAFDKENNHFYWQWA